MTREEQSGFAITPPPTRKLGALRLLSDAPLTDAAADAFGHRVFASALTLLVDSESTVTPLTVSISAPWGAGKTSMAKMMARGLEEASAIRQGNRPNVVCWFNAWAHSDAPHLGAALAASVARTVDRHRPFWRRLVQPLPTAMLGPSDRARRRASLALVSLLLAVIVVLLLDPQDQAAVVSLDQAGEKLLGVGGVWAAIALGAVLWPRVWSVVQHAAQFIDDPQSEAAKGTMDQVASQLGNLMHQARRDGRVIIVVDDLERCQPGHAMEVCDVASQLLAHEGVVTILVADMTVIAASAQRKYEDAEESTGKQGDSDEHSTGRRYLEKLVQIEIVLPPPRTEDMRRLLTEHLPANDAATRGGLTAGDAVQANNVERRNARAMRERLATMTSSPSLYLFAAGLSFAIPVLGALRDPSGTSISKLEQIAVWVFLFSLAGAVWAKGAQLLRRWQTKRAQRAIDDTIDEGFRRGVDQSALTDEVVQYADQARQELAQQRVQVRLLDEAEELPAVEDVILRYPPALPRAAKRMLNHARLLTWIARERGLFEEAPSTLTPAHLGEWIVLTERWPALTERVAEQPAILGELEQAAKTAS